MVSLGFDFRISGDDNRNAKVEVQYRKAGESQWGQALPLMRLQLEYVGTPDRSDPQRVYIPEGLDFRLRSGSPAVDAGTVLPTITDGFTGRAPDLGAFESGRPEYHYGPR